MLVNILTNDTLLYSVTYLIIQLPQNIKYWILSLDRILVLYSFIFNSAFAELKKWLKLLEVNSDSEFGALGGIFILYPVSVYCSHILFYSFLSWNITCLFITASQTFCLDWLL